MSRTRDHLCVHICVARLADTTHDSATTTLVLPRSLILPIEAGAALRQTLGILDDHLAADDPYRAMLLDQRIWETWERDEWNAMEGPDRAISFEIEDAAVILAGLAFTEAMSAEFPWFAMVQWTVDFIAAELRPLWTDDEWRNVGAP